MSIIRSLNCSGSWISPRSPRISGIRPTRFLRFRLGVRTLRGTQQVGEGRDALWQAPADRSHDRSSPRSHRSPSHPAQWLSRCPPSQVSVPATGTTVKVDPAPVAKAVPAPPAPSSAPAASPAAFSSPAAQAGSRAGSGAARVLPGFPQCCAVAKPAECHPRAQAGACPASASGAPRPRSTCPLRRPSFPRSRPCPRFRPRPSATGHRCSVDKVVTQTLGSVPSLGAPGGGGSGGRPRGGRSAPAVVGRRAELQPASGRSCRTPPASGLHSCPDRFTRSAFRTRWRAARPDHWPGRTARPDHWSWRTTGPVTGPGGLLTPITGPADCSVPSPVRADC